MEREFGKPSEDPLERIAHLEKAIEITKRSIAEHKVNGWDPSEYELHLKSYEKLLEKAKSKLYKKAA